MYSDETVNRTGVIGKVIDIDQEQTTLKTLREKAMRDPLTLLYNHETARLKIEEALKNSPQKEYLLIIFDLDCFKSINDNYRTSDGGQSSASYRKQAENVFEKL